LRSSIVCRFLLLACWLLGSLDAFCQNDQSYLNDTGSPAYAVTIPVENGYIDVSNGNLHLEFPFASPPQRGAVSLTEKLVYDSRIWMFSPFGTHGSYHWWPYNVYGSDPSAGGWRFVNGAATGQISLAETSYTSNQCGDDDPYPEGYDDYTTYNITWTDPDGTAHPFDATEYEEDTNCTDSNGSNSTITSNPGNATDGSGYQANTDGNGNFTIVDTNGTQVYPQIVDRYGNYLSTDSNGNVIDDTGRTPVIVTHNGSTTYYDVLAPNGPISNNGTRVRYTVVTAPVAVATGFNQSDVYEWNSATDLTPVQSITLPDGSSYTFGYESETADDLLRQNILSYGELTSVTLPTGGVIHYQYSNFIDSSDTANRWLTSRTVGNDPPTTFAQNVVTACTNYSTGCVEHVTLHKPSGDEAVYELTLKNGAWNTGVTTYTGSAASGQKLVQTTNFDAYTNGCSSMLLCFGGNYLSQSLTTTEVFPGVSQPQGQPIYSQSYTSYNEFVGKPSFVKEWGYASSANTTVPPSTTPTREVDYAYTGYDPYTVIVLDSSGHPAGQTTYGYVNTAVPTSGIAQHGTQNAGGPYLHTESHSLNSGSSATTTYTMNDAGQIVSVTDPDQHSPTTFAYQCSNSLPYQVTDPFGQTTTSGYDCNSGAVTSMRDPNDLAASRAGTTYAYESTAGRLQSISYPDGGGTSYSYPNPAEMDSTTLASPDPSITAQTIADAFGRPYQRINAGASSETTYDVNGRVSCVTNPHLSTPSSTDGSTCVISYDGLDRPLIQQQADGSTVVLAYNANSTTSTDEVGNSSTRTTDAFGHLTGVVEPGGLTTNYSYNGLGNLINMTQHGNGTSDAPRGRTFTYDWVSHPITSTSPEAGTICYGYWDGSNCINGYDANGNLRYKTDARGVTTNYSYDALNRIVSKTYTNAPAGTLSSCYQYNTAINGIGRLGVEWTQSGTCPGAVPSAGFQTKRTFLAYDAMGRLWNEQQCVLGSCTTGPPPPSTCTANGNAAPYYQTYCYDLAGNMNWYVNGSSNVPGVNSIAFTSTFDSAGRLANLTSSWNDSVHPASLFTVSPTAGYNPASALQTFTLGSHIAVQKSYDNRLRTTSEIATPQ
jgi:YD repeat-containing protein